ncbi:helix-turn-helix domain-containing protein [Aeromicrobium duanguangcaii]|uniref:Helix-turn-helix transcriptional regulator n=1 Tax=Aeromicrobium duanguangcaii TaxID=2968086 RepID=A0ABY5KBI4_9ACTN|nr:helix-turn-helix transcriptional regulator [Aeromicrobium duanguangcaii]MCD9154768.1 helix-turn-helix transcriptional regulator [Aeromicrobium duanguangcaii]UUI67817.1 helix-turn-helix transcriptional regulator [Aeromicrobium duanguangcaii]
MTPSTNHLGDYLRARRGLVKPEDAGIPDVGIRRVPGLRREEVAMLAGISADYYLRLERGKDRRPSVQVLESIARVLQLDAEHLDYLMTLTADKPRQRRRRPRRQTVPRGAHQLLMSLAQPAFIEDRYFDILAANPLATALSPRMAEGGNQMRDMFLDPAEQALYPQWQKVTNCFIANLRQSVGTDVDDPRFIELAGELSLASPWFRELWALHDVKGQEGTPLLFDHPEVGEMTLNRERLAIGGSDGLHLVVFHPDPGSQDAEKLAILASSALPVAVAQPHSPDLSTRESRA